MLMRGLTRYREAGLFILRAGLGCAFITHGMVKILGGPDLWQKLAFATHIRIAPVIAGFLVALVETVAGLLLILGYYFRVACILLIGTMMINLNYHYSLHHTFRDYSYAVEAMVIFFSLILIGPGRHSVDRR
jgi:putative oxidoreductase